MEGLTFLDEPLPNPLSHVYVYPPEPPEAEAERVVLPPIQISTFDPASALGNSFTVTVTSSEFVHPFTSVTITV